MLINFCACFSWKTHLTRGPFSAFPDTHILYSFQKYCLSTTMASLAIQIQCVHISLYTLCRTLQVADAEIECSCCTLCCSDENTTCNDSEWLANHGGIWETGYTRVKYDFDEGMVSPLVDYDASPWIEKEVNVLSSSTQKLVRQVKTDERIVLPLYIICKQV